MQRCRSGKTRLEPPDRVPNIVAQRALQSSRAIRPRRGLRAAPRAVRQRSLSDACPCGEKLRQDSTGGRKEMCVLSRCMTAIIRPRAKSANSTRERGVFVQETRSAGAVTSIPGDAFHARSRFVLRERMSPEVREERRGAPAPLSRYSHQPMTFEVLPIPSVPSKRRCALRMAWDEYLIDPLLDPKRSEVGVGVSCTSAPRMSSPERF